MQDYNNIGYDTLGRTLPNGDCIDGFWNLSVLVEDIGETTVRVDGSLSVGALKHRIIGNVQVTQNWSDYGIWRQDTKMWLLQNKTSLDQYDVQSDAKLSFRRMNNNLQVVLPSQEVFTIKVNYAKNVIDVVSDICKELGIRHHEELSLSFPITKAQLKANLPLADIRRGRVCKRDTIRTEKGASKAKLNSDSTAYHTMNSNKRFNSASPSFYNTLQSNKGSIDGLNAPNLPDMTSRRTAKDVFKGGWLVKPKSYIHRARLNSGWLDSSRSLLEHDIEPYANDSPPLLYLWFKWYDFYDLNVKYDPMRIHQLYEQARWSILSGQFECTEEEMIAFATYQLQSEIQATAMTQTQFPGSPSMDTYGPNYYTLGANSPIDRTVRRLPTASGTAPKIASNPDLLRRQQYQPNTSPNFRTLDPGSALFGDASPMFGTSTIDGHSQVRPRVDEVDELLVELEQSCRANEEPGSASPMLQLHNHSTNATLNSKGVDVLDTSEIPLLQDDIQVQHGSGGLLRRYKQFWARIEEHQFYLFKNAASVQTAPPLYQYTLSDCCTTPFVSMRMQKYTLKLSVSTVEDSARHETNGSSHPFAISANKKQSGPRQELWLKFENVDQYVRWLAAFRLGSKGKTLASRVIYKHEVEMLYETIKLHMPEANPVMSATEVVKFMGHLTDYFSQRIISNAKSKDSLLQRVREAQSKVWYLSSLEAKCKYILSWQHLNKFGRSYFIVKVDKNTKLGAEYANSGAKGLFTTPADDMFVVCPRRVELVSPHTDELIHCWPFDKITSWIVNWVTGKVTLELCNDHLSFLPLSCSPKTICEFIGGYILLSTRTPEKNQDFNESKFHQLTGAIGV